ncbi:hypothetical protein [Algiphilus sp.]|uniref:hypothetical protein n=2 Tax=Algiphilus sp. TaxID=1872431 RepID=UPI0025BB0910|nr:hypothetical protein [Algiphilus sp.]MCK5769363.1 hypothetical protein [Algiphilus sp.]
MTRHHDTAADRPDRIDERDLLALADGRIHPDSARARELRARIAGTTDAGRVAAWTQQDTAIRGHYDAVLSEAVPERLQPGAVRARLRARRRRQGRVAVAAAVPAVALAALLAFTLVPGGQQDDDLDAFAEAVSRVPVVSQAGRSAAAGGPDDVGDALPDLGLAGFALSEQRRVQSQGFEAIEAVYEDGRGHALRLFVSGEAQQDEGVVHRLRSGGRNVVYWREQGRMYALAADTVEAQQLQEIAAATMRSDTRWQQRVITERPALGDDAPVVSLGREGSALNREPGAGAAGATPEVHGEMPADSPL